MKPHKHAELIKAWADGDEIEVFNRATGVWEDASNPPDWNKNREYCIKALQEPASEVALHKILSVLHECLPPNGINAKDCISKILEVVDPWPTCLVEPVAYCNNIAIERLKEDPGNWMLIYGKPQHPHTVPLYAFPPLPKRRD